MPCLRSAWVITGVLAVLGAWSGTAYANPSFVGAPDTTPCITCHVSASGGSGCSTDGTHPRRPCLNPFGLSARASGWATALLGDQDGDGVSSSTEVGAGSLPGFPNGAATCSMFSASSSPGSDVACGGNIRVRATHSGSPVNHYTFSFSCAPGTSPGPALTDLDWSDRCLDVNECSPNPCGPGRTCSQRPLAGWTAPGFDCTLVDACAAGTDTCVAIATCIDTPGPSAAFTCSCPHAGYMGDGRSPGSGCTNVNECAGNPCGPNGQATAGSDANGCTERPLGSWSAPGYTCSCAAGYASNGTTCVVQNECTAGTDDCHPLAACVDPTSAIGDFTCTCPPGYAGAGRGPSGCLDVNECALGLDDCDTNATCTNTPGGFLCACNSGYVGDGRTCVDYDECMDPVFSGMCDTNATCNNLVGSFECVCNGGYRGTGFVCSDIDECVEATDDCDVNAACTNLPGTWSCACNTGWSGDGRTCADVDECMDVVFSSRCSSVATCNNLPGSWQCVCNAGFRGDGFDCADIPECAEGLDDCDVNATCNEQIGSFSCACNPGYRGSGVSCADINECVEGTSGCAINEVCVNQIGMPNDCECAPGYTRTDASAPCTVACGDAVRGPGEECDDANVAAGDGCNGLCEIEPGWACFEPTGGPSTCMETCGNGLIEEAEECDDGAGNSDTTVDGCRTTCRRASCGDGVADTGEACDDGVGNSDSAANACRTTCDLAYCGDGVIDTGELCDPGGGTPGAAIAGTCTTLCNPDAGVDPMDPPQLLGGGGCGCRAAPGSSGAGWLLVLIGVVALVRRRR